MKNRQKPKTVLLGGVLILLPILAAGISLCIGRFAVTPAQLFSSVSAHLFGTAEAENAVEITLWHIRFPRILLAMLCGAGLSAAGCVFQSLFANPLATPDTVGVASGASFGAALGFLFGFSLPGVQLLSVFFGGVAVLLTVLTGIGKRHRNLNGIVLAGIMIGSLFSALVSLVKFVADPENQLPAITYWLMGNLEAANYPSLFIGAPAILAGIAVLLLLRWRLNLLILSPEEARSAGVRIGLLRGVTVFCATLITASCISMCGQVGWIGLLVPHLCRMRLGNNHTRLLPACISVGAAFLVAVDTVARSATATEIPISILTAIIGAPFFVFLMRRTKGWQL